MPPDERLALTGTVGEGHVHDCFSPTWRGDGHRLGNFISLGLPRIAFCSGVQEEGHGKVFNATVGGGTIFPGVFGSSWARITYALLADQ
jgi:hypothetical protein